MTRQLGYLATIVALAVAVTGLVMAAVGARRRQASLVAAAYNAVYANAALLALATGAMVVGLVTHDFSIGYVAQVGSRSTPTFFTVISLWSALEGSILFWGFVLASLSAAVVFRNRRREGNLVPYAAATLLGISAFFYLLLVGPANPWHLVSPVPADGPGPNPLLQNHPLMAVHPPLLYLGYVGMSVPFAFAVGALLAGEIDRPDWIVLTRRYTLAAWGFLSLAIMAGMWWSYEVLGWGGYWAWDPVENASFLPWLTATAFLHSVMVQERRGMLKLWNVNLIAATFLLTILGTFLTRSGVLSSVHAFTTGTIGYYFLGFIAVGLVATFALVAGNSEKLASEGQLDAVASRETAFLLNNLLLTAFTFTVLLGTLFPLVAEAVKGVKVSVGAPFFNQMTVPLCAALLFLMGVGPSLPWRRTSWAQARALAVAPALGGLAGAALGLALGMRDPFGVATVAFASWALVCTVREYQVGVAARMRAHGEALPVAVGRLVAANRRRYGGYVAHLGILMTAVAIAGSSDGKHEKEATLKPGQTLTLPGATLRFRELWGRDEPHRQVIGADIEVLGRDGRVVATLDPRLNFYRTQDQPVPTPAVRSRPQGDLYLTLMAFTPDGATATIRAIQEPLVPWIWVGGFVVALGALVSGWPTVRGTGRRAAARVARPPPAPAPGPAPTTAWAPGVATTQGVAP